ncbi:hypothetical protein [Amycolatopsis thermoflava]|uniref:hypothetical protein n=1 Tax=Amycolatopsis thermoflava TaxID=84480 RepID=UPI003EB7B76E
MKHRTCDVEGCTGRHVAKGYCGTHYTRWRRTGSPFGVRQARIPNERIRHLRALVGLPEDGPTDEMRRRWIAEEAADAHTAVAS